MLPTFCVTIYSPCARKSAYTVRYGTGTVSVRYGTVRYSARSEQYSVRYRTVPYGTIPYRMVPLDHTVRTVPYRTGPCVLPNADTVPYRTVPYGYVWYRTVPEMGTIRYGTVQYRYLITVQVSFRTVQVPYHTIPVGCRVPYGTVPYGTGTVPVWYCTVR